MKRLLILPVIVLMACQNNQNVSDSPELGYTNHQFKISEAAKGKFNEGLLLLHSFEYEDAREAFEEALENDPDELMVHWGLAMTHYKALWGLQNMEAGREIINSAADIVPEDDLEQSFWESIKILYGEGEFLDRNRKYADYMGEVYEKYPNNLEVASFYSLGLMWASNGDQDYLTRSADIAAGVIEENAVHPGALHYIIHANDDPEYAQEALDAADEYAQVAPDAAHALHMPSHIYVALGMWNEVVASNEDSYAASISRMERKNLSGKSRGYHSMAWLHYGLLQQGNYTRAAQLLEEMIAYHKDSVGSDSYLIKMQNQQRVEEGKWPSALEAQNVSYYQLGMEEKSSMHFFRSLLAFDRNDAVAIKLETDTLLNLLKGAKLIVSDNGLALCSAGPTRYAPNKRDIEKTTVVIHQMKALKAMAEGNPKLAEEHLITATKLEEESSYDPGPPFIAYPSFEQYGDWLLRQNRPEEALVQFNKSLANRKLRAKALKGKIQALEMLGRAEEKADVEAELKKFWIGEEFIAGI